MIFRDDALGGDVELFVVDIRPLDPDATVAGLFGQNIDPCGAGRRRIGLRLTQPQILCGAVDLDAAGAGVVGADPGIGFSAPDQP